MQQSTRTITSGTNRYRALKVAVSAALGIGLLAGSAAGVAAQEPLLSAWLLAPAAAQDGAAFPFDELPIRYTWENGEWPESTVWGTVDEATGAMRGLSSGPIEIIASDPRFSGHAWLAANGQHEQGDAGVAMVESRAFRVTDQLCTWTGTSTFVLFGEPPEPPSLVREMFVASGQGACEGLSVVSTGDYVENSGGEAIIFANPLPPAPEVPAAATAIID